VRLVRLPMPEHGWPRMRCPKPDHHPAHGWQGQTGDRPARLWWCAPLSPRWDGATERIDRRDGHKPGVHPDPKPRADRRLA
jgi:hypothetical protein